ncbi:MAG: hypothetical protein HLUCCO02_07705 [Idiomarinaceae bacterium HL-53]|nr:MAG: hypothetical protein HLUCCO02_07705 [Idiomarinaceae bacterium HL-53]
MVFLFPVLCLTTESIRAAPEKCPVVYDNATPEVTRKWLDCSPSGTIRRE